MEKAPIFETINRELDSYKNYLFGQGLSANTQRDYVSRLRQFLSFLMESGRRDLDLADRTALSEAVFSYWDFLKNVKKTTAGTLNNNLTAIDSFFHFLGVRHVKATSLRERAETLSTRILSDEELNRFLAAAEKRRSSRDRALALVLVHTGIKISECRALDVDDVVLTSHTCKLIVRNNGRKQSIARELTINDVTRKALLTWLIERSKCTNEDDDPALFLSATKRRLGLAGIDFILRRIGWSANLVVSAQTLRRTFLTNQLISGQTPTKVAMIAGYSGPSTVDRYLVRKD
jgi:site-specific recombinase XerD